MNLTDRSIDELFELAARARLTDDAGTAAAFRRLQRRLQRPALKRLLERLRRFRARDRARPRLSARSDMVLLLLLARGASGQTAEPVRGITRILKLLFLATKELGAGHTVAPAYQFQPYRFGPFAAEVYDDIEVLVRAGLVSREELDADGLPVIRQDAGIDEGLVGNGVNILYRLTEAGERFAQALAGSAERRSTTLMPGLELLKSRFGPAPLRALLRHVYSRWPEYTTESELLNRMLDRPTQA